MVKSLESDAGDGDDGHKYWISLLVNISSVIITQGQAFPFVQIKFGPH